MFLHYASYVIGQACYFMMFCWMFKFCNCLLSLSARDVFKIIHTKYKKSDLVVGASFFEIYSGKVSHRCLL